MTSETFPLIGSHPHYHELQMQIESGICGTRIGRRGTDSDVYLSSKGDTVYKIYSHLDIDTVRLYMTTTDRARKIAEGFSISIPKFGEVSIQILPIDMVYFSRKHDRVVALSEFVSGENFEYGKYWDDMEQEREFDRQLRMLSKKIEEDMGVEGVFIIDLNVKIRQTRSEKYELVITDLCSAIEDLKQVYPKPNKSPNSI